MAKEKKKGRTDGLKERTKQYRDFGNAHFTGRKHFYGKTKKEIDEKIRDFEAALMNCPEVKNNRLEDIADAWWAEKEETLSPNSVGSYQAKLKEIEAEFGDFSVDEITAQMIYSWLRRKAAQGLAQRGITDRKSVMNKILEFALAKGYININPCASVPAVKGARPKKRHPASDSDVEKIEAHKTDSLIARLYYFMEYTGCRIGECVVLQEKDIDREHHKASIYKDLAFKGQDPIVKQSAKTEAGSREIDLYDNVLEILPRYDDPETYIFFPDGLPRKSPYETALKHYRRDTGVKATAHQMRHTYAGIMHSAEIDVKDTQAHLGHSSIVLTQDIYTEIERKHSEKVRNKANKYIMEERLGKKQTACPKCGSTYTQFTDGHNCTYCPDCGTLIQSALTS